MTDEIHAAHRASNHLPRLHPGRLMFDPWAAEDVTIDLALADLMAGLWNVGIRTVASCQNVAEFAQERYPAQVPAMLASTGPLSHARTITDGLAYVRIVLDEAGAAEAYIERARPHLAAVARAGPLVQIEIQPQQIPKLAHVQTAPTT